jgi:hypothetical protein
MRAAQVKPKAVSEQSSMKHRLDHISLEQAKRWSDELEALLQSVGVSIAPGSELERVCLAPAEILGYLPGSGLSSAEANRQYLDAAALAELAARLLKARQHPSFATLLPHLELLNHGDPRQAGRASPTDDPARKLFEMFTALLAMQFSESVELAQPVHGSSGNPDVVVHFQGKKWGLACKVPTSANPESLVQNLAKAVEQVVASEVEAGVPMFNLKNVIPPESYWRADPDDSSGRTFFIVPTPQELLRTALQDAASLWQGIEGYVGGEAFAEILSRRPCVPVALSYLQVLAPVDHGDLTSATTSRFVSCYHISRHLPSDTPFIDAMHASAIAL